jgi:hypothetical protein
LLDRDGFFAFVALHLFVAIVIATKNKLQHDDRRDFFSAPPKKKSRAGFLVLVYYVHTYM